MRIVIGVLPLAGHVGPLSGLVAALVARGHDVRVHTGRRYLDRFAALGARPLPWMAARDFDETDIAATFPRAGRPGPFGAAAFAEDAMVRTGTGQARDLLASLAAEPADLLAGDVFAVGVGLAAACADLPWAAISALPPNFLSAELPPPGMRVPTARGPVGRHRDRMLRRSFRWATGGLHRAYADARRDLGLGLTTAHVTEALYSPQLVLATGAPSMERPRRDLPPAVHFVGRLPPTGSTPAPSPWPPGGPLVVVTQGTHNVDPRDLLRPAAAGLADLDVTVVATTGRRGVTSLGRSVPGNVAVVDFLDFATVWSRTVALVTNGGWGTVLEAAAAGVPMVVAGRDIDKPENAARVARAGAGLNLHTGRPRPAAVATAVARVLTEPRWAEGARRLGAELAALGGADRAVDLLERLAATRAPVLREADYWPAPLLTAEVRATRADPGLR